MSLAPIDVVVVVAYAVGIFALALYVSRDRPDAGPRNTTDYFLASKGLPWWAIGASLIAANISAEQIVGMAGSGYAIGLAIASYEWMAALTLLIVAKFFLPIFLRNEIYTMPQFLERRYGRSIRTLMAVFWLALYVFVNLTSIIWLGSIAINKVAGVDQTQAMIGLGAFALLYQIKGGLRAVAMTDIVQVTLLVVGGLVIVWLTLGKLGAGDVLAGWHRLAAAIPDHFHMILKPDDPHYMDLPGLSVLIGGMWIANLSYWGFNQYIIQRALAAKNLDEAQRGMLFASGLKLVMPLIIVLPGIAAVLIAPDLPKADEAYPTVMRLLPSGLLGLVFAALIAAIVASTASKINSIATIFTLDVYAKMRGMPSAVEDAERGSRERHLVRVGRIAATIAVAVAIAVAKPLVGSSEQAFLFIQEFTGFFTPGITVIFLLGLFWKPANEAGAIVAAVASVVLSWLLKTMWATLPFMNRMALVFAIALVLAVGMSLLTGRRRESDTIVTSDVRFATSGGFNIGALGVCLVLVALYATWW